MANIGQTMFRFFGALVLGAGATLVDHPQLWRAKPVPARATTTMRVPRTLPARLGAVTITPGKRAMSVHITDGQDLAALIGPNSRVDVLVIMDGGAEKGRVAKLFMQNVRLLAIGSGDRRTEGGPAINIAVATLEVTPAEGERLAIASSQGQIHLMVRAYGDSASSR